MTVWKRKVDLDSLNRIMDNTLCEVTGMRITAVHEDALEGTMPVDSRTHQPLGLLHGGASVALAESLGSMASNLAVDDEHFYCVGQEINANHLRAVRSGCVTGVARPVHLGNSSHVWEIRISTEEGKLCCISRITMAVLRKRQD